MLTIGVIITGSYETQVFSTIAAILWTATFFFLICPMVNKTDDGHELEPLLHSYRG